MQKTKRLNAFWCVRSLFFAYSKRTAFSDLRSLLFFCVKNAVFSRKCDPWCCSFEVSLFSDSVLVHVAHLQRWESSGFCQNSGFLMVPKVILEIHLNCWRKVVCVYVHYNCELLTLCAPATITFTILYQFSLSWVGLEAYCLKMA